MYFCMGCSCQLSSWIGVFWQEARRYLEPTTAGGSRMKMLDVEASVPPERKKGFAKKYTVCQCPSHHPSRAQWEPPLAKKTVWHDWCSHNYRPKLQEVRPSHYQKKHDWSFHDAPVKVQHTCDFCTNVSCIDLSTFWSELLINDLWAVTSAKDLSRSELKPFELYMDLSSKCNSCWPPI